MTAYNNGISVDSTSSGTSAWRISSSGSGRLVVGKRYSDDEADHMASVRLDELVFWNSALSDQDVRDLYDSYMN